MEFYQRAILDRFIQNTGARPDSARDILKRCNWDYHSAIEMFSPGHQTPVSGGYGYPATATVRHVPIIYVGNQTQVLPRGPTATVNSDGFQSRDNGRQTINQSVPQTTSNVRQTNHSENIHPIKINNQPALKTVNPGYRDAGKVGTYGGSYYGSYGQGYPGNTQGANVTPSYSNQTGTVSSGPQQKPLIGNTIHSNVGMSSRPMQMTAPVPQATARPSSTNQQMVSNALLSSSTSTARPVSSVTGPSINNHPVSSNNQSAHKHPHITNSIGYRPGQVVSVPITHLKSDTSPPISHGPSTLSEFDPVPLIGSTPVTNSASCPPSTGPGIKDSLLHKAPLVRSDATEIDEEDGSSRTLKRGISKTSDNLQLVTKARDVVMHDIRESTEDHIQYFVDTPELTFILPDLTIYSEDFRGFLEKDLIETSTLISLEQAGCLNWWADVGVCQRLHPMATTGDGNCLLHAASLAMWGFHDRDLILRKALYNSMTSGAFHGALFRQWRYQQTQINKQTGLIYNEEEWRTEWENLLRLASTEPRRNVSDRSRENSCCDSPLISSTAGCRHSTVVYESLEEFHVFVLSHVLRRPIVVVADKVLRDTNGEALAPIPFGGIYLPIGCKPQNCHHTPLLLTYDAAHFSALVPMKRERSPDDTPVLPVAMPILDCQYNLLPLHFCVDPGENFDWSSLEAEDANSELEVGLKEKLTLIEKYMSLSKLPFTRVEGDNDSDQRSNGSVDSDESGGGKDKRKDTKLQQQVHSVGKGFGSIGRSMGKKLKKNFGNIGKSKGKSGSEKVETGSKNATIASGVTQTTKISASIPMMFDHEQVILCAQLSAHRSDMQEQLVNNYLTEAKKRFEADRDLKRQKAVELKSRLPLEKKSKEDKTPVQCVTPNCSMFGTASNSYLCSDCYSRSKKQALEQVKSSDSQFVYNTYPGPRSQTAPITRDPLYRMECGKSKFYAPVATEEQVDLRNPQRSALSPVVNNIPITRPKSAGVAEMRSVPAGSTTVRRPLGNVTCINLSDDSVTIEKRPASCRAPSPDCHYDNVDYAPPQKEAPPLSSRRECLTSGCNFFGSESTRNYCSKCFKERQQPPSLKVDLPKTHL